MSENNNGRFVGFERLKQSISIEQVLERYGFLDKLRRNADSLSGVCPLHQGHNATQFRVSLSKNCWICFGDCHSGGSIVDFVSRKEGVGIREAGLLLQDWFNVKLGHENEAGNLKLIVPVSMRNKGVPELKRINAPLRFTLGLLDGEHSYLKERGLAPEAIATFGLGYCAHGSLRGWIAIPIHDAQGRLVAYAGRWPGVPPDGLSKYRLPRGFSKSLELFNQHRVAAGGNNEPLVLSTWRAPKEPPHCCGPQDTPENHAAWARYWEEEANFIRKAVAAAIDRGELSTRGWQADGPTQGS